MIYPRQDTNAAHVAQHYDDLDKWYREVWGEHVHHGLWETGAETAELAVLQLIHRVARETDIRPDMTVIDIGCGYGGTARMLAKGFGAKVIGFTLSKAQYDYALGLDPNSDAIEYRLQNWFDNDLPDAFADVALSIESSEHMEDKSAFLAEVFRVLKPGGRLAVCSWLAGESPRPWEARYLLEPICTEGRLPSLGSEGDYRALLASAGFQLLAFYDLSKNVKKTWSIIIRRTAKRLASDPEARRFLFSGANRVFGKTIFRLWVAYRTGSLRYGLFVAVKPESGHGKMETPC